MRQVWHRKSNGNKLLRWLRLEIRVAGTFLFTYFLTSYALAGVMTISGIDSLPPPSKKMSDASGYLAKTFQMPPPAPPRNLANNKGFLIIIHLGTLSASFKEANNSGSIWAILALSGRSKVHINISASLIIASFLFSTFLRAESIITAKAASFWLVTVSSCSFSKLFFRCSF